MRTLRLTSVLGAGALIGGAFYLLLIDTTDLPELCVLAGVAVACGVAFLLSREQGLIEARVPPVGLLAGWRVLARIPPDVALLCADALAQLARPRAVRGRFRAVAFAATQDEPGAAGRRALSEWLGSLAPNTIVVGVDTDRRLILVHQLHGQGEAEGLDPLRLG